MADYSDAYKGDPEETEEAEEISHPPTGSIITDSGGTVHISTGGGKWMPVPSTHTHSTSGITTGMMATGGVITSSPAPKPPVAVLAGPTRRPRKLLVAFLGDDDEVEWCAKVNPDDIDVCFDKDQAAPRLELGFWLIDAG